MQGETSFDDLGRNGGVTLLLVSSSRFFVDPTAVCARTPPALRLGERLSTRSPPRVGILSHYTAPPLRANSLCAPTLPTALAAARRRFRVTVYCFNPHAHLEQDERSEAHSMSEDKAKKLAAEVRSATESTSFDLAGYGPQGCEAIVSGGLSAPLPLKACRRLPNEYAAITLHPITSTQPPPSCHL